MHRTGQGSTACNLALTSPVPLGRVAHADRGEEREHTTDTGRARHRIRISAAHLKMFTMMSNFFHR
jgi:hypothetical protein